MQVRAAVGLAAFFLVIALGAVALSMTAAAPSVSVDQPDHSLMATDEFSVGDRIYTVDAVDDDGATLEWVNPAAERSETWENGSTIEYQNASFSVLTDANASPPTVTITEQQEIPDGYTVMEINESEYVVEEDDPGEPVPIDEFLLEYHGEPEEHVFELDDTLDYQGAVATVAEISADAAELTWTVEEVESVGVDHGESVILGPDDAEETFYGHIEGNRLQLTSDTDGYEAQLAAVDRHGERLSSLWGIGIISVAAAGTLLALAFLPVRRT